MILVSTETFTLAGSSNLASADYDDETQQLEITFADGSTYAYSNVPQGVVAGLKGAGSAGQYWNRHKGRFSYRRIG